MRIRRTKKIDRKGLIRMSRRFGIAPLFIDQLQRGEVVELPDDKAEQLISHGYALRCGGRPPANQVTVDDQNITTTESATESIDDFDDDDSDDDQETEETEDEPSRDIEL